MSARTRDALMKIDELGDHHYGAHRSHQISEDDVEWANVILAAEFENVNYARVNFGRGGNKAVQLAAFVRFAPPDADLDAQLRAAAAHEPSAEFNIEDPAGGDQATYDACARQLWDLAQVFALIAGERVD
jgi:protein-tyrosine-phosphatase